MVENSFEYIILLQLSECQDYRYALLCLTLVGVFVYCVSNLPFSMSSDVDCTNLHGLLISFYFTLY